MYAISTAPEEGWGLAAASACWRGRTLLVAFFVIEARVAEPLLPLGMLRNRSVGGANLVGFALGGSFYAFLFVGTLYMQQVLGFSALQTGLAWLATSLMSSRWPGSPSSSPPGSAPGRHGHRDGDDRRRYRLGHPRPCGGSVLARPVGPFLITGAGTAFAFIPISVAGLAGVAQHQAGVASGLLNTAQQIGGALGVAIASTVATTHVTAVVADGAQRLRWR